MGHEGEQIQHVNVLSLLPPMLCISGTTIKTGDKQARQFADALCLSITNKDY
jgi:hypothetical protein